MTALSLIPVVSIFILIWREVAPVVYGNASGTFQQRTFVYAHELACGYQIGKTAPATGRGRPQADSRGIRSFQSQTRMVRFRLMDPA